MVLSNDGCKAPKSNSVKNVAHKGIEVKLSNRLRCASNGLEMGAKTPIPSATGTSYRTSKAPSKPPPGPNCQPRVSSDCSSSKEASNTNVNDDLNHDSVAEDTSTSTNAPSLSATDTSLIGRNHKNKTSQLSIHKNKLDPIKKLMEKITCQIVIKSYGQNPASEKKKDCYPTLEKTNLDRNIQAEFSPQCNQQGSLPAEEIMNTHPLQYPPDVVTFPCPHAMYPPCAPCICGPNLRPSYCNNNATRSGGLKQLWKKSSRVFKGMSPTRSNKNYTKVIKQSHDVVKDNEEKQVQFDKNINSEIKLKRTNKSNEPEKIEIYYFDRGNSAFYQTTDSAPVLITDYYAEKTETSASLFWAELFGVLNIGLAFVTSFILQFCRFLLVGLLRPLTIGLVQLISDYCFKPSLSVTFNGIIQPPLIFLYNILHSLSDLCKPIARGFGYFGTVIANVCQAIRFVEINRRCSDV